jgi:hypothetical protein
MGQNWRSDFPAVKVLVNLAEKSCRELTTLAVSSPIPSGLKMSGRDGGGGGGGDTFL